MEVILCIFEPGVLFSICELPCIGRLCFQHGLVDVLVTICCLLAHLPLLRLAVGPISGRILLRRRIHLLWFLLHLLTHLRSQLKGHELVPVSVAVVDIDCVLA